MYNKTIALGNAIRFNQVLDKKYNEKTLSYDIVGEKWILQFYDGHEWHDVRRNYNEVAH